MSDEATVEEAAKEPVDAPVEEANVRHLPKTKPGEISTHFR